MVLRMIALCATVVGVLIGCAVECPPDENPSQCTTDEQCFDANPAAPACIHGTCQPSPDPASCTYAPGDPPCDAGTWDGQ